ncbi:MAG: hypothetical protein GW939_00595 [Candidatus Magasanikbacteria bacterium]|nr:hypothetical protein [Candidatus Magasanikbacteria bacterium]NCS72273.1 hypothetical protein [Candidatus Magasanikbacteria bacterium]
MTTLHEHLTLLPQKDLRALWGQGFDDILKNASNWERVRGTSTFQIPDEFQTEMGGFTYPDLFGYAGWSMKGGTATSIAIPANLVFEYCSPVQFYFAYYKRSKDGMRVVVSLVNEGALTSTNDTSSAPPFSLPPSAEEIRREADSKRRKARRDLGLK